MSKRLFVGNVNPQVTEDQLRRFFATAGEVVRVSIPLDRATGQPRGFAFVEFANEEEAERALETFDDAMLEGRRIRPRVAYEERGRDEARRRRDRAREAAPDFDDDNLESDRGWSSAGDGDYSSGRARDKPRKRGKHGTDRKRGQGTRRYID